jgi:hypothetical protein
MPTTQVDLFRALKNDDSPSEFHLDGEPVKGLLYPRFQATTYTDNEGHTRTSNADVDIVRNEETDELEVQTGGGTSLHDVSGWFGYSDWKYFQIHSGTEYPEGLVITKDKKKKKNRAKTVSGTHYQIEPKIPMRADTLKGYLDLFARNAVVRSIQLANS